MKDIKQVIIVRKDLNLKKTELASQVATASMGFILENNESERHDIIKVKLSNEEADWLNGSFEKIIVGVDSEKDLNYLLTSEYDEGLKPEEFIQLLNLFKNEYRLLHSKNRSLEHEVDKLNADNENYKGLLYEIDTKWLSKIANLEDQINFLN